MDEEEQRSSHIFGLSSTPTTPYAWITYQFTHSDLVHLLSNLIFLWLLGMIIESYFGGGVLVLLYLLGGISGGVLYLSLQGHGTAPMIGASASISALVGFFAASWWHRRWPFAFFIAPFEGFYGIIYLPALVILPLLLVSDLAQVIAMPEGLGLSIAHGAHVGGALFGLLMGIVRLKRIEPIWHGESDENLSSTTD